MKTERCPKSVNDAIKISEISSDELDTDISVKIMDYIAHLIQQSYQFHAGGDFV